MSVRSSEGQSEMESENLSDICQSSNRKIVISSKDDTPAREGSLERLKQAMKNSKANREGKERIIKPDSKNITLENVRIKNYEESNCRDSESTRDESKLPDKPQIEVKKSRNRTVEKSLEIKEKSIDLGKRGRPVTATDELMKRPSAYNSQKKILQGNTILKVEGAFSKKISIRKDQNKENAVIKKLEIADAFSDDEDSIQTIKKHTTSKSGSKKKIKHKLSVCILGNQEPGLARHFLESGEWRKVNSPDDAAFTFVINERKLDWDISLKTMVKQNL